jgi:hypothetical protein
MLDIVPPKPTKPKIGNKRQRAPRIRVPNNERAIFSVEDTKFVGVIQRLSLTGGSAVLSKGPILPGEMGDLILNTVYGKVTAHIEFLHTGADGVPLAQAFRFLAMDDDSSRRYAAAAKEMERHGFSDAPEKRPSSSGTGSNALSLLMHSVRRLAASISSR